MNFQVKDSKRKRLVGSTDDGCGNNDSSVQLISGLVDGQVADSTPTAALLVIPLPPAFGSRGGGSNSNGNQPPPPPQVASLDALAARELTDEATGVKVVDRSGDAAAPLTIALRKESGSEAESSKQQRPLLLSNLPPELLGVMGDEERFKKDISLRAEDISAQSTAYDAFPIHEFGAAMLRGMGWSGPTKEESELLDKKYNAPIVPRDGRVGLGATAKPPDKNSRGSKEMKEKEKAKWAQLANEKLTSQQLEPGQLVWIRDPMYAGRRAAIIATQGVPGLERIRVSMESDGRLVELKKSDVVVLTDRELADAPYKGQISAASTSSAPRTAGLPETNELSEGSKKRSHAEVDATNGQKRLKSEAAGGSSSSGGGGGVNWLRSGIRVRVVSKKAAGSAGYLQKATVLDVYDQGVASLRLDNGSVVEGVKQKHLETVLPSCGQPVIILSGVHSGRIGQLLEKFKDREEVVVQFTSDDLTVVTVSMDHCSSFA